MMSSSGGELMKYYVELSSGLQDVQLARLYPIDSMGWFRDGVLYARLAQRWEDTTGYVVWDL